MILGERFADPEKSAYELITGKKDQEPDFDRCPDFLGPVYKPHKENFKMIEAYLEVRRLGRPLTEEEMEKFKY